jgi:hypothetical protein
VNAARPGTPKPPWKSAPERSGARATRRPRDAGSQRCELDDGGRGRRFTPFLAARVRLRRAERAPRPRARRGDAARRRLPFGNMRGLLDVSGKFRRLSIEHDTPYVEISAKTTNLVVNAKSAKTIAVGAEKRSLRPGMAHRGDRPRARRQNRRRERFRGARGPAHGRQGAAPRARCQVDARFPTRSCSREKRARRIFSRERPLRRSCPRPEARALDPPAVLKLGGTDGELEAEAEWHGTFADPSLDLRAKLDRHTRTRRVCPCPSTSSSHRTTRTATPTRRSPRTGSAAT